MAFILAFIAGWLVEWGLIRFYYKRPLDTLLATWGLSLAIQQVFRSADRTARKSALRCPNG